ncbi:MAG TPA: hypothetical protein PLL32_02805 [Anaeromyxobacteraceae bacterium]|nr:hypothetical protein [Anaeromyxobacteraceae bacterium]
MRPGPVRLGTHPGGVMKNNVRILLAVGGAAVLFALVYHWFPQR